LRDLKVSKIGLCFALIFIGVLFITGFFSLKAYNSTKYIEKKFTASVQNLKQEIDRLESRIEEFGKLIKRSRTYPSASNAKDDSQAIRDLRSRANRETIDSQKDQLKQMNAVKESTGIDQLSATGDIDPVAIQEIVEEHIKKKEMQSQINYLREINVEQRQKDKDLYGDELNDLYRRSLPSRFGNKISDEEREKALNELIDKYPDSYAAAKAVAIQTMVSARNNNVERAEKYYNMLNDVQTIRTDNVVLDNGLEAVPAVLHNLAWAYYRTGRTEDINMVVQLLEENYYDSLYRMRTRGGFRLVTGEDAINRIRRRTGVGQ